MSWIAGSVGRGGVNERTDVSMVQVLLSAASLGARIAIDGVVSTALIAAIEDLQRRVVRAGTPDGRIDPNGRTIKALVKEAWPIIGSKVALPVGRATRMNDAEYERAASALGVDAAAIKAVAQVESLGKGFFSSGRPKILFEAHVFSKYTAHRYDITFPAISSRRLNRALYRGGDLEYDRLMRAMVLDREAALVSASWGRFQVMGFNHGIVGFRQLEAFIGAMFSSEGAHLDAFLEFVKHQHLIDALRNKNWAHFAFVYNGEGYLQYDRNISVAYEKFNSGAPAPHVPELWT